MSNPTATATVPHSLPSRHPASNRKSHPRQSLFSYGPYHDYCEKIAALTPSVVRCDPKNRFNPIERRPACLTMLKFKDNSEPSCREFTDGKSLREHFDRRSQASNPSNGSIGERRVYILEGLNTVYVGILGAFFLMDPLFFANHEQVSIWDKNHFGTRMTESLPSQADTMESFCLPYFEMMHCSDSVGAFQVNCKATGRHIAVTRTAGVFEKTVVVRRKCSFWSRKNEDGGWDAVILTDPPIQEVARLGQVVNLPNTPFQGGYLDFLPRSSISKSVPSGPPRTSMHDDLLYYWNNHQNLFVDLSSPTVATFFPRKIVASHYMQLLLWARSLIATQEWHLSRRDNLASTEVDFVEGQWSDLQALSRRCVEYCEDVERIMLALGIKAELPDFSLTTEWMDSTKDFQLIYSRLLALKARSEVLGGSITALVGIVGNRQSLLEAKRSFREAKNVKTLTLVGMIFIPLAFICGLFSMSENFLPGSGEFWVYWATAMPLVVVVFLGSVIANWGYDDDAGTWSMANVWHAIKAPWRAFGLGK